MPVQNGGTTLQHAVDSILEQTHQNLELILVDDHSSDQALTNLVSDDRVKLYSSSQRGIVPALNLGLSKAQNAYIARMDADDLAAPQRLEIQFKYQQDNPEIDIVGAKVNIFKDSETLGGGYQHYQEWINQQCTHDDIARSFFIESCIPHPTAFMHRSVLDTLAGYQDTPWPEDYDLWCRAYLAGFKFGKPTNESLLKWRDHEARASRTQQRYAKEQFLRCKARYLSEWLSQQSKTECVIWGAGPTGLKLHDYLLEHGITINGFVDINPKLNGGRKRDKPVHVLSLEPSKAELHALKPFAVIAVGSRGARDMIRRACGLANLLELEDFVFAA